MQQSLFCHIQIEALVEDLVARTIDPCKSALKDAGLSAGEVDEVILVDDNSSDNTAEVAKEIGINHIIIHDKNKGYGGNQKIGYQLVGRMYDP